jgi:hypothetical protein
MTPRSLVPALALAGALVGGPAAPSAAQQPDYPALWEAGADYRTFHDDARGRRALWDANTERADVPADLLARARAVPGRWRLLAVALDRCSDSVNTLPYIAALVARVDGLELRIVSPDDGRAIMEAHRTPDGRAATPTVLLLADDFTPAGAWVERPAELQAWFIENPEGLSHDRRYDRKMEWYDRDAGASTIREVVELMEAAGT